MASGGPSGRGGLYFVVQLGSPCSARPNCVSVRIGCKGLLRKRGSDATDPFHSALARHVRIHSSYNALSYNALT